MEKLATVGRDDLSKSWDLFNTFEHQKINDVANFPSDLEIAQSANIQHIKDIAAKIGVDADELEFYGKYSKAPFTSD